MHKYISLKIPEIPKNISKISYYDNYSYYSWGEDNLFPYFLNYLYYNSPLHSGIVNGKVLRMKKHLKINDELFNRNEYGYFTIEEIIDKILFDYELKNAFAIKINKINNNIYYDYLNIDNIRILKNDNRFLYFSENEKYIIDDYFLSDSDESVAVYFEDNKNYIDIKKNRVVRNIYPSPTYIAAISSILTDIEISNYHLSEIYNGFVMSAMINFNNGIPDEEEQLRIISQLRRDLSDRDKKCGVLVTFNNSKESAPEVIQLNHGNIETRYLSLAEEVRNRIIMSHSITSPIIFGIKTPGQLGGVNEIENANKIFENNYIYPRLNKFLKFINQVFKNKISIINENSLEKTDNVNLNFSYNKDNGCCEYKYNEVEENEIVNIIFDEIKKRGINKDECILLCDDYYENLNIHDFSNSLRKVKMINNLNYLEYKILSMIISGENISKIKDVLNISSHELLVILNNLKELNILKENYSLNGENYKSFLNDEILTNVYVYKVRPGLGDDIIPTTRKFCREMISLTNNKYLLKKDIDEISEKVGRDVWLYRGGYYYDNDKKILYPYCRHIWQQQVVLLPKKYLL